MSTLQLTEREKEIISVLNSELWLDMSPEEQASEAGLKKVWSEIRCRDWSRREIKLREQLHSWGIALLTLNQLLGKIGKHFFYKLPEDDGLESENEYDEFSDAGIRALAGYELE